MTHCPTCQVDHPDGTLDLARTKDLPHGIDVLPDAIAIWLRCPCGQVLAEVYDRATGRRFDCEKPTLEVQR